MQTCEPVRDVNDIKSCLEPLRSQLLEHPLYAELRSLSNLRAFMEHHVFAVWDFMSLLKALQREFTCTSVPWLPPADHATARLINEIVLGEETDDDGAGGFVSHFDLYRRAMRECGASTSAMDRFIDSLGAGESLTSSLDQEGVPPAAREFVRHTFAVIESRDTCAIGSLFTFGREDLLPSVFQQIVDRLNEESEGRLSTFVYYLRRHIDLDGDQHGPMAAQLMQRLCGDNSEKWDLALRTAEAGLRARLGLWDGMWRSMTRGA